MSDTVISVESLSKPHRIAVKWELFKTFLAAADNAFMIMPLHLAQITINSEDSN